MLKIPDIVPVSEIRQNTARILRDVRTSGQPLVITQRGRAAAVVLSMEAYERGERERQILLHLARGEREIMKGVGRDLGAVLAKADELLRTTKR
jgi:prevent-host-death family protein